MKLQIGDKVKFLNNVGGGIVTKIEGDVIYILNQDDFEIPTMIKELLLVGDHDKVMSQALADSETSLDAGIKAKPVAKYKTDFFSKTLNKNLPKGQQDKDKNERTNEENLLALKKTFKVSKTDGKDQTEKRPRQVGNHSEIDKNKKKSEQKRSNNTISSEPKFTTESAASVVNPNLCIYLAFVPEDKARIGNCEINTYLINDSSYFLLYNLIVPKGSLYETIKLGRLEPDTKIIVEHLKRSNLTQLRKLIIQIIPFQKEAYDPRKVIDKEISIDAVKFFKGKTFIENDFFDEDSWIIPINEENLMSEKIDQLKEQQMQRVIEQKEVISKKINTPKVAQKQEDIREVIDLHIEELIEDESKLLPEEMLAIQLENFRKKLLEAIDRRSKSIVFIHGIGNGKLKMEIRKELDLHFKKYAYQDASFQEYGWGATMVILR
jgi:hypothetical protein